MWTIFKVFIEFVTTLLLFYVFWFFGREACGVSAPWPGVEPAPPALEGKVLTTGPPGKSLLFFLSPFPYYITFSPYNNLWIANIWHFTNEENFWVSCWRRTACEGQLRFESRSNWSLTHNHGMQSVACFSQVSFSMFIPRVWHSQDYRTPPGHLFDDGQAWDAWTPWNGYLRNKKRIDVLFLCQ